MFEYNQMRLEHVYNKAYLKTKIFSGLSHRYSYEEYERVLNKVSKTKTKVSVEDDLYGQSRVQTYQLDPRSCHKKIAKMMHGS